VSGGWEQVAALCRAAEQDLAGLTSVIVEQIRSELGDYASVPGDEHRSAVEGQIRALFGGLAARRRPSPSDAARARQVGARRARQGLPVEVVIAAYHVGYREAWNALVARAEVEDPALAIRLLRLVNLAWTWVQSSSAACADGHAEAVRASQAATVELGHRFIEALYVGEAVNEETVLLARALAFDPDAAFCATCTEAAGWDGPSLEHLREQLNRRGSAYAAVRGSVLVIVSQHDEVESVATARMSELLGERPIGVGLRRKGLQGAAASIVDAERSLTVARRTGGLSSFESDWLAATLMPHRHELAPVLASDAGSKNPHLAEALAAYAQHGFSVTAAGDALHLHPNTLKYRLDRWQQLTGWNPRTVDGLQRSLLSIQLY
jgi:PucR C-terminal helix-turn-helix domain